MKIIKWIRCKGTSVCYLKSEHVCTLQHLGNDGSDQSCRDITIGHLCSSTGSQYAPWYECTLNSAIWNISCSTYVLNFEIILLGIVLIQFTFRGTFHINNGPHVVAGVLNKYHGIYMTFISTTGKTEQESRNQIFMTVSEEYLSLLLFQWSLCNVAVVFVLSARQPCWIIIT